MMKILAAIIAATFLGCGGVAVDGETLEACEMRLALANPGPDLDGRCFRAIAGHGSCVRLPGDAACEPFVVVNYGQSYEAWTCAEDWGAPTLTECKPDKVVSWSGR